MLKVGITGGIGAGKSLVCQIFNTLGVPVFNADTVARGIFDHHQDVRNGIVAAFGSEIFSGGKLNRKKLAGLVFNDEKKLERLNSIVHPAVHEAFEQWSTSIKYPYILYEAAILFESGVDKYMDKIIMVYADEQQRISRVMERDQVSEKEIRARMSKQISEETKMNQADFIIYNDEDQMLIPQVMELHEKLMVNT